MIHLLKTPKTFNRTRSRWLSGVSPGMLGALGALSGVEEGESSVADDASIDKSIEDEV